MTAGWLSVKGRLLEAQHLVVLLIAGLEALQKHQDEADQSPYLTASEIATALERTAQQLSEHLYWLSLLPDTVLCAPAPDDDEASESSDPDQIKAARAAMVEGVLRNMLAESHQATSKVSKAR